MNKQIVIGIVVLFALLIVWPNLVHEPLHIIALEVQGSSGYIQMDWKYPIAPVTHRTEPVAGILGGLLFMLLPSLFSVGILVVTWLTWKRAGFITHVILPFYLTYDLVLNILSYGRAESDFRFLIALPTWVFVSCLVTIFIIGAGTIIAGMINTHRAINVKEQLVVKS